MAMCILAE